MGLRTSDTSAKGRDGAGHLRSKRKLVRRSPSSTSSQKKCSKRKITLLFKAMFSIKGFVVDIKRLATERWLEAGSREQFPPGSSQSSQEQWSRDTPHASKWKEITRVLHETEQTIMERQASWQSKESQKWEEEIWIHAEELRTHGSNDDRNKKVRLLGLRRFKNLRDEAEET